MHHAQAERDRLLHRSAALGHDRPARQPAGTDAELRPLWRARAPTSRLLHLPAGVRAGPRRHADGPVPHAPQGSSATAYHFRQRRRSRSAFGDAGYKTGYIGKWHLDRSGGPVVPGSAAGTSTGGAANAAGVHLGRARTALYDSDGETGAELPGYRVDALTDAAIRYVDTHRDEPFYFSSPFLEPTTRTTATTTRRRRGYASITAGRLDAAGSGGAAAATRPATSAAISGWCAELDEAFGRLLDALGAWTCATTRSCSSPPTTAATSRPATASTSVPVTMLDPGSNGDRRAGFTGGGESGSSSA